MKPFRQTTPRRHRARISPLAGGPAYVIDVSRPVVAWRWTDVLLAPVEMLAMAWSVPFVLLLVGIPIALVVTLVLRVSRLFFG